jgi:hypothetical protein
MCGVDVCVYGWTCTCGCGDVCWRGGVREREAKIYGSMASAPPAPIISPGPPLPPPCPAESVGGFVLRIYLTFFRISVSSAITFAKSSAAYGEWSNPTTSHPQTPTPQTNYGWNSTCHIDGAALTRKHGINSHSCCAQIKSDGRSKLKSNNIKTKELRLDRPSWCKRNHGVQEESRASIVCCCSC